MTDEITTKLSKIQGIDVASHSSVAALKGTQKNAAELSKQLGVRYLLEGSVRKAGNQVRINVQLIDSNSAFQVWADDFTGNSSDVFSLQEQTALKIAQALNLRLTPQEQSAIQHRDTQNPQAYDAYLRGRALLAYIDDRGKLEAARKNFEDALRSDANYAPALAGLSLTESYYFRNIDHDPAEDRRSEELARKAISLDPQLAEGHTAMANVYGNQYDYVHAAEEGREATRLEPDNADAWDLLSWALAYQQPPDSTGAEKAARESIRLESTSMRAYYHLGRALLMQGRYQEATAAFEQARVLMPSSTTADFGIAQIYIAQGDFNRAIPILLKSESSRHANPVVAIQLSFAYAGLNQNDKALDELKISLKNGYRDFPAIDANPQFKSLSKDPRFQTLLNQYRK